MRRTFVFVLLAIGLSHPALSQTITWVGGGSAAMWTDSNNWNPARLPNAADDVAIPAGSPIVTVGSGTHTIRSISAGRQIRISGGFLTVLQTATLTGFIVSGGTLTLDGPTTSAATNQISAGLLTGDGDITCNFNTSWTGGEIAGRGRLILNAGTATLSGPTSAQYELVIHRSLEIYTTCNFTLGTLTFRDGADLRLGSTGTLNFGNDPFLGNIIRAIEPGSTFDCDGRVNQTNVANMLTSIELPTSTGHAALISVTGMALSMRFSGDQYANIQVAANKSIGIAGSPTASFVLGALVSGEGYVALSDVNFEPGTLQTSGGVVAQGGTVTLRSTTFPQGVTVSSGTLDLYGDHQFTSILTTFASTPTIRVHQSLSIAQGGSLGGGTFDGQGTLTFLPTSLVTLDSNFLVGFGCTTQNYGIIEPRAAGIVISNNAIFTNRPSGVIRLQSGSLTLGTTPGTLVNEGLITSNFPGVRSISGIINAATGIIETVGQGGLSLVIPAMPPQRGRISSFADISINGPVPSADITFGSDLQLSAGGRLTLSRGNFAFPPDFAPTATELSIGGASLYLDASLLSIPSIVLTSNSAINVRAPASIPALRMTGSTPTAAVIGSGDLTITSTAQLDGTLAGTGRLTLAPTCTATTTPAGTRSWSRPLANQGNMTMIGGTITLSNTTLTNTGTFTFDTASNRVCTINGADPALFRNTGLITSSTAAGTGAANINCRTDQLGIALAPGTNLNFNGPVNQIAGDMLTAGRWVTNNNGIIRLPNGTLTRVIGPGAAIVLGGASNSLPWLGNSLYEVGGELAVQGARTLTLTPAVPTGFTNLGRVILGTNASMSVLGTYRQVPGAVLVTDYDEPPIEARLRAFNFELDGEARANFTNGFMIDRNVPLRLLDGGAIENRFALSSAPQSRRVIYAATSADWRIECTADIDNGTGTGTPDGGVTIDDLLYFLDQFAHGTTRADFDDGSGTGMPDGGVTIDDLVYFLFRYDAGC